MCLSLDAWVSMGSADSNTQDPPILLDFALLFLSTGLQVTVHSGNPSAIRMPAAYSQWSGVQVGVHLLTARTLCTADTPTLARVARLLILCSGFFVASKDALSKIRMLRTEQMNDRVILTIITTTTIQLILPLLQTQIPTGQF